MKRYLKSLPLILMLGSLAWIVPACKDAIRTTRSNPTKTDSTPDRALSPDEKLAQQTVVSFLTWYKNHIREANRIPLVNQTEGKPYSVNPKNGERYLTYLKSSLLLTDTYLDQWRQYFKKRQEVFLQSPQDEGPPIGFDYDLVMQNQDVDMQFAELKSLEIGNVSVINDHATVRFALLDDYEFRLMRQNGHWLINEIVNQTQK